MTPIEQNDGQQDRKQVEPEYVTDYEIIDPAMILGGIAGPMRTHHDFTLFRGNQPVNLTEPRRTQYVLIQESDGELEMVRWDPKKHGQWSDIPQIGGSIGEFMEQIEGMGTMTEPLGFRFRQVQRAPGTAMHTFDSTEKGYRKHGAIPGFRPDHSGGRKLHETDHRTPKTGGRALEEHTEYVIELPGGSFLFDASRREINRNKEE